MDFYYTIDQPATAEFKDRGSRFLGYAFPITSAEEFKKQLQLLKKEHPKAVHHCFAYRIGTDGNNFRSSDDGEPAGTGGKPILGQIDSKGLTDTAIIAVRYFGGTLLGVPGLINAYKTAAALALQVVPIIKIQIEIKYSLQFDYTQMNVIMTLMKQFNCTIISQQMQMFCDVTAGIPANRSEEILYRLKEFQNIEINKIG